MKNLPIHKKTKQLFFLIFFGLIIITNTKGQKSEVFEKDIYSYGKANGGTYRYEATIKYQIFNAGLGDIVIKIGISDFSILEFTYKGNTYKKGNYCDFCENNANSDVIDTLLSNNRNHQGNVKARIYPSYRGKDIIVSFQMNAVRQGALDTHYLSKEQVKRFVEYVLEGNIKNIEKLSSFNPEFEITNSYFSGLHKITSMIDKKLANEKRAELSVKRKKEEKQKKALEAIRTSNYNKYSFDNQYAEAQRDFNNYSSNESLSSRKQKTERYKKMVEFKRNQAQRYGSSNSYMTNYYNKELQHVQQQELVNNVAGLIGGLMDRAREKRERENNKAKKKGAYYNNFPKYAEKVNEERIKSEEKIYDELIANNTAETLNEKKQLLLDYINLVGNTYFVTNGKHYKYGKDNMHVVEQKIDEAYFKDNTLHIRYTQEVKDARFEKGKTVKVKNNYEHWTLNRRKYTLTGKFEYKLADQYGLYFHEVEWDALTTSKRYYKAERVSGATIKDIVNQVYSYDVKKLPLSECLNDSTTLKLPSKYERLLYNLDLIVYKNLHGDYSKNGLQGGYMDKKFGFIDKNNQTVIPFTYDFAYPFKEGLAIVRKDNKYGAIDINNKIVVPVIYDNLLPFSSNGLAAAKLDNKYGFINKKNQTIIPFLFKDASTFDNDGFASVSYEKTEDKTVKNYEGVIDVDANLYYNSYGSLKTIERLDYIAIYGTNKLETVEKLDLRNKNLTSLPESISKLTNLKELDISRNKLSYLPESIEHLTKLHTLKAYANHLTSLPENIGKLISLKKLDLSSNHLKSLPKNFGKLNNLEVVFLGNNALKTLPENIGQLSSLYQLYAYSNQLTTLPNSFGNLKRMAFLKLDKNKLSSLPTSFNDLTNLRELELQNNKLTSIPLHLGSNINLTELNISHNPLKSLPVSLVKLNNLVRLTLPNESKKELKKSLKQIYKNKPRTQSTRKTPKSSAKRKTKVIPQFNPNIIWRT